MPKEPVFGLAAGLADFFDVFFLAVVFFGVVFFLVVVCAGVFGVVCAGVVGFVCAATGAI